MKLAIYLIKGEVTVKDVQHWVPVCNVHFRPCGRAFVFLCVLSMRQWMHVQYPDVQLLLVIASQT